MATRLPTTGEPFVRGSRPSPWTHTFNDLNEAAINLTGYTAEGNVTRSHSTTTVTLSAVVDPDQTANTGKVTVTWSGDEFAEAGVWTGTLWVGNGTNREAEKIEYEVEDYTGSAPTV